MTLCITPNGRLYHPGIGRFMSRDPQPTPGGNGFAGLLNNPLRVVDPSGRAEEGQETDPLYEPADGPYENSLRPVDCGRLVHNAIRRYVSEEAGALPGEKTLRKICEEDRQGAWLPKPGCASECLPDAYIPSAICIFEIKPPRDRAKGITKLIRYISRFRKCCCPNGSLWACSCSQRSAYGGPIYVPGCGVVVWACEMPGLIIYHYLRPRERPQPVTEPVPVPVPVPQFSDERLRRPTGRSARDAGDRADRLVAGGGLAAAGAYVFSVGATSTAVLAADDATVIGVADDVLIPFTVAAMLVGGGLYLIGSALGD